MHVGDLCCGLTLEFTRGWQPAKRADARRVQRRVSPRSCDGVGSFAAHEQIGPDARRRGKRHRAFALHAAVRDEKTSAQAHEQRTARTAPRSCAALLRGAPLADCAPQRALREAQSCDWPCGPARCALWAKRFGRRVRRRMTEGAMRSRWRAPGRSDKTFNAACAHFSVAG